MNLSGKHLLSTRQFDRESLLLFFEDVKKMEKILKEKKIVNFLAGKILATLFFEPSTRTRFSFEAAMHRLGGDVISGIDMMKTSSAVKGESLEDTGKVVSQIADVIVMRHPEAFSVQKLASKSDVPVINAGDGTSEHPTQALLDIYTIWKNKGTIDGMTIGMIGDLKNGRVPHSQCDLLKHFDIDYLFVSPEELKMPVSVTGELFSTMHEMEITTNFEQAIQKMDVIACTRIQKERFKDEKEYKKYVGAYVLNEKILKKAKPDAIIIHPLPRVNEISVEVDEDSRAKYFEQVKNGVATRMVLLAKIFGVKF